MKKNQGKLLILSAPSGAGKTSLARALVESSDNMVMSISHTTRPCRNGEQYGVDYYFVGQDTFLEMVEKDEFLEYAKVYDYFYGTSKQSVEGLLEQGINVLLDIDWQGAHNVRQLVSDAISVSILPPSKQELERRLRSRGRDSDEVIEKRMQQALDEMRHCREADFLLLNDDFNQALSDLTLILAGQSDRIRPLNVDLDELLESS